MLDNKDVILFLYKKMVEEQSMCSCESFLSLDNAIFSQPNDNSEEYVCQNAFYKNSKNLGMIVNVLFFFTDEILLHETMSDSNENMKIKSSKYEIQYQDTLYIANHFLQRYLEFNLSPDFYIYLKKARGHFEMDFTQYCMFLEELYKYIKQWKKKGFCFDIVDYDVLYVECFYIECMYNKLFDLWKNAKYKQFVQTLFVFEF